jgi:hypothetical protein
MGTTRDIVTGMLGKETGMNYLRLRDEISGMESNS